MSNHTNGSSCDVTAQAHKNELSLFSLYLCRLYHQSIAAGIKCLRYILAIGYLLVKERKKVKSLSIESATKTNKPCIDVNNTVSGSGLHISISSAS